MDSIKMTTEQQLPKGWTKTTLEEICEIFDSKRVPLNREQREQRINNKKTDELFPYYGATGEVGKIDDYIFDGEFVLLGEDAAPFFEPNKNVAYCVKGKFWVNNHAHILSSSVLENLYICHYLNQFNFSGYVSGTTRLKLSQGSMKRIPIIYPTSKETQQAIVNKIESLFAEIDEGIGRLKTAAQQIQQYRQSLLKNAFNGELTKEWRSKHADTLPSENELLAQIQTTREQHHAQQLADWQNITIGEVVTISPKKEKAIDDDTDVSFSSMHLMSSSLSEHLTYEIKKWADVKKGFTVFRNNDVLLAKITPCFENGKSAVAQDLINGIGTGSTEFMVLRCSNQILPKFLYFLVNTPEFRQAGIHNMTGSVGHKRVPKDFVSTWAFSLPPLAEQTEIVAILESKLTACDQLAAELAKQLKQAELLKQAVLKAAFSGSLLDK